MDDAGEAQGLKLVSLGFVAVIAIAGLVLMLTQTEITGQVSSLQKLGTQGIVERTPYEACRAVHTGSENGVVWVWNGVIDPRNNMIACVDPTAPDRMDRVHWVELAKKR